MSDQRAAEAQPKKHPSSAPESDQAAQLSASIHSQMKLGADGHVLYDLASKSIQERARFTGETTGNDAVMREVNRIMVDNGYQDAHLDGKSNITMRDLPKTWNEIKTGQSFKIYNPEEQAQLTAVINERMAQEAAQRQAQGSPQAKGRDHYDNDGAPENQRTAAGLPKVDVDLSDVPGIRASSPQQMAPRVTPERVLPPTVIEQSPASPERPVSAPATRQPVVIEQPRAAEQPRVADQTPARVEQPPREQVGPADRPPVRFPSEKAAEIPGILDRMDISPEHTQMAVVVGRGYNNTTGVMQLYQRQNGHWQATNEAWPVNVGENGMAWGDGLLGNSRALGQHKHEGDGKAPAGLFTLGTAFGRSQDAPEGSRLNYRQTGSNDYFVDDPNSQSYNRWVRLQPGQSPDWRSAENMRKNYQLGVVVNHNMNPVIKGDGSAIFLHTWSAPGVGTAGCTTMSDANMRRLMRWLNPGQSPLLLQVPNDGIDALKRASL